MIGCHLLGKKRSFAFILLLIVSVLFFLSCATDRAERLQRKADQLRRLCLSSPEKNLHDVKTLKLLFPIRMQGAEIIDKRTQCSFLHAAALFGSSEFADELIRSGADVNAQGELRWITKNGNQHALTLGTPLHCAATNGTIKVAEILIRNGAKVDCMDQWGNTPLVLASKSGQLEVACFLLENGAHVNAKGNDGMTALIWAAESGHTRIVNLLLRSGADVDQRNNYGQTALHRASANGNGKVVKVLLDAGATANTEDFNGFTAKDWAKAPEIRELFGNGK